MFIGLALLCDDFFIPCLERICEVLHVQPDVAGSSAPELATTLVGVFIAKDDIGLGAVVGSADFNIMLVVSVSALFAKQVIYLNWWPLVRDSAVYLLSIILLALVIYDELVYW
ncbi:putative potassium-dependent sodium-calcium exchanger 3,4 [Schistosoma mansoni]|uniref:Putative potassium-dependent sodium-calcium exchanger 3,4 n=1 Tax=Schistosoma mansoni TaxID=6183 RepID=G4VDQ9_SCHMA|nr:putative potassium-dependent sodium-calcium exchanger 3,4 [Schistosoma mansoni]|eukprot:XP_018649620.1 putative potassium-dependent sodium-calcium exchanger 3,4 [Schistosoma mansoni]